MQVKAQLSESQWGPMMLALKNHAPQAAAHAINRSLASGKTIGQREVASDMKLKVGDVAKFVRVEEASKVKLVGRIFASAKRLPLKLFGARPGRRGVIANTPTRHYPGTFIAKMASGHVGVYERITPSRSRKGKPRGSPALPIRELFYVSIAHVFVKKLSVIKARVKEQLAKNVAHELKRAIRSRS